MKKILAIGLSAVLACGLWGCSDKDTGLQSENPTPSATVEPSPTRESPGIVETTPDVDVESPKTVYPSIQTRKVNSEPYNYRIAQQYYSYDGNKVLQYSIGDVGEVEYNQQTFGFMHYDGSIISEPIFKVSEYKTSDSFYVNGFLYLRKTNGTYELRRPDGTLLDNKNNGQYSQVYGFSDGLSLFQVFNSGWGAGTGFYGYLNLDGKEAIARIEYANGEHWAMYSFYDGLAVYAEDGKFGHMNKEGKVVIPCKYGLTNRFGDGLALFSPDENVWSSEGFSYGFIDTAGNVVIAPVYSFEDSVSENMRTFDKLYFSEGLCLTSKDGEWGYIDKSGTEIVAYKYDNGYPFSDGIAWVELEGKWGIIDCSGKELTAFIYNDPNDNNNTQGDRFRFHDGLLQAENGDLRGVDFIDRTGNSVFNLPKDYRVIQDDLYNNGHFSDGFVACKSGWNVYYFDKSGNVLSLDFDISMGGDFIDGLAPVRSNDRWGVIDRNGNIVLPLEYDSISLFHNGNAWAKDDSGWWLLEIVK